MSTKNVVAVAALALAAAAAGFYFAEYREGGEGPEDEADEAVEATTPASASAMAAARVSDDSARVLALAQVPGGKITEGGIETEDGKLIYSFDITVPGKEGVEEIHIDAMTGEFLRHEHESEESEAAEKAKDVKKEKGGS